MLKFCALFISLLAFIIPAAAQSPTVSIVTPAPFQVFQRNSTIGGVIEIKGTVENAGIYQITARWGGFESGTLYEGDNPAFDVLWSIQSVWTHDLLITVAGTEYIVSNVSIGDVYVIAGQSNAMGMGRHYQIYMNALGLRAGMFTAHGWSELADPTGRAADNRTRGSAWPLLATYILANGIPVAFIPVAIGSSYIAHWQPSKPNYHRMTNLMDKLSGAKAILWQQGEADVNTPPRTYADKLLVMATALYKRYQIPTFAAHLYHNTNVNAGIDLAVAESWYVLHGADLYDLPRDKPPHYVSDESLQAEAWRWYQALEAAGYYP